MHLISRCTQRVQLGEQTLVVAEQDAQMANALQRDSFRPSRPQQIAFFPAFPQAADAPVRELCSRVILQGTESTCVFSSQHILLGRRNSQKQPSASSSEIVCNPHFYFTGTKGACTSSSRAASGRSARHVFTRVAALEGKAPSFSTAQLERTLAPK